MPKKKVHIPEVLPPEENGLATDEEVHALWHAGVLNWKLWDQQDEIYDKVRSLPRYMAEYIVFLCARQFGKSFLGLLLAFEACLRHRDKCFLYMGPTAKQAMEIARPKMKEIARDSPRGLVRPVGSLDKWEIGSCELVVSGFNTNSTAQRGKTLQDVYVEEVRDADPDNYNTSLKEDIGPALTHSDGGMVWFFTTPPNIPDHPFIIDTLPAAELTGTVFRRTIYDNKVLSPRQFDAFVKRCGGIDTDSFKREGLVEIIRDPKLVCVPAYDDSFHVRAFDLPVHRFQHVTGDNGGTRDMFCWLNHTYDFQTDTFLIWDELQHDANTSSLRVVRDARMKWGAELGQPQDKYPQGADGSNPDCRLDAPPRQLVDMADPDAEDFHATLVPKDDWQAAVNAMAVIFSERGPRGEPKIIIHPRCAFLRTTLRSGTFNKQRNDFNRTKTLGHMDALAALMYALRTQNRMNPWPSPMYDRDHVFKKSSDRSDAEAIAQAVQPKSFGSSKGFQPKKFGKFK